MKKYNNLILALLVCLVCQPTAAQAFRGQIVYTLREKDSTHPFCTYSFNDYFVKKTDTASGSLFVTAGFTEIIWDIREKMQYLINHGTGVIYFSKYQDEGNHKNLPLSESKIISGRECLRYEVTDSVPLTMNDLPDTFVSSSTYFVAKQWKLSSPPRSEPRYDPINLSSGYIPLYISSKGGRLSSTENNYHTIIEATSIQYRDIGEEFFQLPAGYQKKAYSEKEIRDLLSKAAGRKIDFMEMAKKIIRQRGLFPITD